jgi:hypothetical protein
VRHPLLPVLFAAGVLAAGCGGSPPPEGPVRLSIDHPADGTLLREGTVEVSGHVVPSDADVTVEGRPVTVKGGAFSSQVQLAAGTNLVDVFAASKRARPAMVALRVRRELSVRIPDLAGLTPADAKDALAGLGLKADVKEEGGLFELLLPEDARVCGTEPPSGELVDPGTVVTVHVAKTC